MVRNYKRKGTGKKWTDKDMQDAIEDVTTNWLSVYAASKKYAIPKETLRVHAKNPEVRKPGHPNTLSDREELEIVETCQVFSEWGFGLTKHEVFSVVGDYLRQAKRPNPFKDGVPGDDWWQLFLKRHPDLMKRKPQALQMIRAKAATPERVEHWFKECLEPTLDKLGLREKPHCIFNVDESGFPLSGRPAHIICKRGMKSPQSIIGGSRRENITVQVCVSGSGHLLPPYVIFTGKHLMAICTNGGPVGTRYGVSVNGWMTTPAYIDWFKNLFITSLPDERPILLILDGHSSHVSYEVRQLAIENDIHMLKLPPHLTHLLQPLDVGVFKPMKAHWYTAVADFTRKERSPLTKRDFPRVFSTIWKKYNPESAIGGFRGCGIYPFNSEVIPLSSLQYSESFTSASESTTSATPSGTSSQQQLSTSQSAVATPSYQPLTTVSVLPSRSESPANSSLDSPMSRVPQTSDQQRTSEQSQLQTTPTPSIVDELGLTPDNDPIQSAINSVATTTTPLREYFGKLLQTSGVKRPSSQACRKRLVGVGESLTSEDAMKKLELDLNEKKRKEEEKMERKRKREEKKREKENRVMNRVNKKRCKRKDIVQEGWPSSTTTTTTNRYMCTECESYYDDEDGRQWVECETCFKWYHATCVGLIEEEDDNLEDPDFICDACM